jgi:hypothetical protein
MWAGKRFRQGQLLAVSLVFLIVPIALTTHLWAEIYRNPLIAELDAAQQRWDGKPFNHYRMTLDREQLRRRCHQSMEVQGMGSGEEVVSVFEDTCMDDPLTVSGIFSLLRQAMLQPDCNDDECKCRITYRVSVLYDEELGYPSMALFAPNRFRSEVVDTDVWGLAPPIVRRPDCPPVMPAGYETISIRRIMPLP